MDYITAIKDLASQGKFRIELGPDRISALLNLMGNPQDKIKCIQVAGTNGKGSVCTMLAAILNSAGYKTGLYTSPHIFDYTERIRINDSSISETDFAKYYSDIIKIAEENDLNPTEFEILTAVMFKYFYNNEIDIAIIETGLGGRLDATNIVKSNLCSIITHIDLDHTDRLGCTKEEIAFEKAGIIKSNSFVITGEGYEAIKKRADETNSMLIITHPCIEDKYINSLALKGEHQKENLALVLTAVETVFPQIDNETIISGLKKVKNPCRFQYIKNKNLIIDGAHNPNCFEALRRNLDEYFPDTKRNYIFGCLNTKDYKKMLSYIETDSNLNKLYFYPFKNANSCSYEELSKVCSVESSLLKSKAEIDAIAEENLTVICGSFYMINELVDKDVVFS